MSTNPNLEKAGVLNDEPKPLRTSSSESSYDKSYFNDSSPGKKSKKLPPWLDHFNAKDLKILFKCSLSVWLTTILIFINPTLNILGQATFFGCVVLFISPPSGVVFIQLLVAFTLVFGMALGPAADLAARYALLQQQAQNTTNIGAATGQTTYTQIQIFEGFMLDTRVTAVYFSMLSVFIYFMARLRVAAPKLALVSIFATIIADIALFINPLVPTFQGTTPKVLILPVAVATAIGLVCNLLIFLKSTSQIVVDGFLDVLGPMQGFIGALHHHFKDPNSGMKVENLLQTKAAISGAYKGLEGSTNFLPMDLAVGRFSPKDIASLEDPLRQVVFAFSELLQLQISREEHKTKEEEMLALSDAVYDGTMESHHVGHHQIHHALDMRAKQRHPDTDGLVREALEQLHESAAHLVETLNESLQALQEALSGSAQKSKDFENVSRQRQEILATLRKSQTDFASSGFSGIFQAHAHLFDDNGHVKQNETTENRPPLLGLMLGVLYQERMLNLAHAMTILLKPIVKLESNRRTIRIWAPLGIGKLFSWALGKDDIPSTVLGSDELQRTMTATNCDEKKQRRLFGKKSSKRDELEPTTKDGMTARARLDRMHRPTGRNRQRASNITLASIHWLGNTEGLFTLRVVIVTIALALPAVIPSSAGFYYREKGMWALIMAQMGLVPYASDFVSGILVRGLGTVVGGLIGLVVWYIGAGKGSGNPYGMAAIITVFIVLLMWWRLYAPPAQMAAGIMLTSTMYMVVSYSWIDTHIPSYGNPGVGYNVVWRRILLVLIGFAAATIVTFIPKPPSGSRHHRRLLSEQLGSIKDRYALFASTWRNPPSDLADVAEKEALMAEELLVPLDASIKPLKYEFSTSNFDAKTLSQVLHLIISLNQDITQLLLYTNRLSPELRESFVRYTGAADEGFIADLMAVLSLIQHSLRSGDPLPALLPTPLLGRSHARRVDTRTPSSQSINAGTFLADESGRKYVSAARAFLNMLSIIDELVIVVKMCVGETSDVDLERL